MASYLGGNRRQVAPHHALAASEFATFGHELRRVHLALGTQLFGADDPMEFAVFPVDAVISLTGETANGDRVEISMVGPEGVVGAWMAESAMSFAPWTGVAQAAGEVLRLPADRFRSLLVEVPRLREMALEYSLMQSYLMSRSVLCNRFHDLIERTARWLLTMSTTTAATPLPLTQEFLSQMLGSHRPSVTLALQTLSTAGLIRNEGRGQIRILDMEGLQEVACDCFAKTQEFDARIIGGETPSLR